MTNVRSRRILWAAVSALVVVGAWWSVSVRSRRQETLAAPEHPGVQLAPQPDAGPRVATSRDPPARKPPRRLQPPRFVVPPAPTRIATSNGHELDRENPNLMAAISGAAHGKDVTEAEFKAGVACIRELGRRQPALIDATNMIRGAYVVTIETRGEEAHVVAIEGRGKEDKETFECLRKNRVWLSGQKFPAPGAPDGLTKLEWPYRVGAPRLGPPPGAGG
jgi:hypothetical protein